MGNFITNAENAKTLKERVVQLIDVSKELKFLVGFFYFSGWKEIYEKLKNNKDVVLKILVGLDVEKRINEIFEIGIKDSEKSNEEFFANFIESLQNAINNKEMDNMDFYRQVHFFIDMLQNGRLHIRKTLTPNHSKLYLFKVKENNFGIDAEFITGSSNLTKAGLESQNEFNVEIRDYGFKEAEEYFDSLWETAVPLTDSEVKIKTITDTIENKTIAAFVKPFEAYAYILKTYIDLQMARTVGPQIDILLEKNGFKKYKYQIDAVNQALNIINTYNGVIIADVVGLGKSVIASLIAKQLNKRGIVICPPALIGDRNQSTGWWEYLNKFELYDWDIESTGKIEELAETLREHDRGYEVVIVDEAHRFRNQDTAAYEALSSICKGKQVILLTATPFNNTPADIFSLLKLFIVPGKSGITIEQDIEARFTYYNSLFSKLSMILKNGRSEDIEKIKQAEKLYKKIFKRNPPIDFELVKKEVEELSKEIKSVISPVVIRRNRLDLKSDYEYKKEIKNLSEVEDPKEMFYELTDEQDEFYRKVTEEYFSQKGRFIGAIYKPFEYEKGSVENDTVNMEDNRTLIQQRNLYDFMRRLLVKRFESSFGAFEKSVNRFLKVHKMVLEFIKSSGKYILDRKVIESIYNEEEDADSFISEEIEKALKKFKDSSSLKKTPKHTRIYDVNKFKRKKQFINDIEEDLKLFEEIKRKIEKLKLVENDPKLKKVTEKIKESLKKEPKRKIVIFSEYTDTVKYLEQSFDVDMKKYTLFNSGNITKTLYSKINENFNAQYKNKKDDYKILVTSDKLSEGVNLNRAGLIINYDIPWNPTRVIQRLGRINRIGSKVFDKLYIYNFFPTKRGSDIVKSREIAAQKMFLIHNALGEDSKIFDPSEEPTASGLFKKINSVQEEEEKEMSLLTFARNEFNEIKKQFPAVIDRIQHFPNRVKTAKPYSHDNVVVVRKKGLAMFAVLGEKNKNSIDIHQIDIKRMFDLTKCSINTKRLDLSKDFWEIYSKMDNFKKRYKSSASGISIETMALNSLKSLLKYENLDEEIIPFINTLIRDIKNFKTIPKYTLRKLVLDSDSKKAFENLIQSVKEIRKILGSDYLKKIIEKTKDIEDDIIIAVENRKM